MKKFVKLCRLPLLVVSAAIFLAFTVCLIVVSTMPHGKVYTSAYKYDVAKYIEDMGMGELTKEQKDSLKGVSFTYEQKITFTSKEKVTNEMKMEVSEETKTKMKNILKEVIPGMTDEQFETQYKEYTKGQKVEYTYVVKDVKLWLGSKDGKVEDIDTKQASDYTINSYKLRSTELDEMKKELDKVTDKTTDAYKTAEKEYNEAVKMYTLTCKANVALQIVSIILMVVGGVALVGCIVVTVLANKGVIKTEKAEEAKAE